MNIGQKNLELTKNQVFPVKEFAITYATKHLPTNHIKKHSRK